MDENIDQIPDEVMDELESIAEKLSANELQRLHIESLIDDAIDDQKGEYSWPYESGPSKVWNITFQTGIDRDFVNWWLVAQAIQKDGTPLYLVQVDEKTMSLVKVEISEIHKLSKAFQAAEEHWFEEVDSEKDFTDTERSSPPPTPSETPPSRTAEERWEYVVDKEGSQNGKKTLAIRRAPALDNGDLRTYVLERRNGNSSDDLPSPIGTFWGHHSGHFMSVLDDAASRLG